jgi:transcriptional regulator with XRE-family HTH domain
VELRCLFAIELKAVKPKPKGYPCEINSIGDHIRKARLDRCLQLAEVAAEIGVTEAMVSLWEMNRNTPTVSKMPGIVRFLGFAPYEIPKTFGAWLLLVRTTLGYSQRKLAHLIGGDQRSIHEWECDLRQPTARSKTKLKVAILGG